MEKARRTGPGMCSVVCPHRIHRLAWNDPVWGACHAKGAKNAKVCQRDTSAECFTR